MRIKRKNSKFKRISKHLFQEIVENNTLVASTVCEYEDYEYLSSKLDVLKNAKIRINNEMQGKGLRRTYVAIGKDWLEASFVSKWKQESELIKKEIRFRKIRKNILTTSACIFFVATVTFYSYILYDGIKPGFGDNMKSVRSGELVYDDLKKFTNSVFHEVKTSKMQRHFSFWSKQIPPEMQAMWNQNLYKVKEANTYVDQILIDPKRKGIYHIKCKANIPDFGNIEFRMQCAKRNGQYTLLALE